MNIILIGFMGCGKTTVGGVLAEKLGYAFVDLDDFIAQEADMSVSDIFATYGEDYFRELEKAAVRQVSARQNTVISTGGGVPTFSENIEVLKNSGVIIFLKASAETIIKRLKNTTDRPLLTGGDMEEKINQKLIERTPVYTASADIIINADADVDAVTEKIIENLRKLRKF